MTAIEKLFVQIFERKKWIIDQAKHQTELFDQHLASKLIIDGIVPPPWLQASFLHSHTSHFNEVNKNFISGVEFPRSPPGIHHSSGHCSNKALVADSREKLQQRLHIEAGYLKGDFDAGVRQSVLPQCHINDAGCASNGAFDPDMSPISPQCRGDVLSEDYQDPTLSLARLHRSKSRQRALEIRNSVKSARCQSRSENKDDSIAGGIIGSAISSLQSDHKDELGLARPSNNHMRDGSEEEENNFCCERKDISNCSNKITTFGSRGLQPSSLDVDNYPYISDEDGKRCSIGSLKQDSDQMNEQLDLSKPSSGSSEHCEEAGLGYCRSQEYNFDNAEQSGLQRNSLDVDNSLYIFSEDGKLCPSGSSKLHSDQVKEQLEMSKPSSGNFECREEVKLGYCRSQMYNFDNVEQSGLQHSSLDVDYSSGISSEDGSLCPIQSLKQHSNQVSEQLDLSKTSSGNVECCEGGGLADCRSQDYNFDNAKQSNPSKISSLILERRDKSSDKKPSTFLDDKKAVNEKEKCNSSFDMPLPQIQVDFVKEKESHKGVSHSEERCEVRGALDGNTLSSAHGSLQGYKNASACSSLRSDEPPKQNISSKDQTSNLQFSHENLVEIPLMHTDNAPVLIRDSNSFGGLILVAPCVPSCHDRAGNLEQQLKNSGILQYQDSDSLEGCISNCKDNCHCIPAECQIAEKLTDLKAFSSDLKASGPHNKHIEVEAQLDNGTTAFLGLRDEKLQILNKGTVDQNLMHEDDNQKPLLEYQRLSFYEEDYLRPNVSKNPVEIMHLKKETDSMQRSKSSCRLLVQEGHSRFESNKRDTTMQNVTLESQMLDPQENLHLGDNEPIIDSGKSKDEMENGKTHCSFVTPHIQTLHYIDADKDMPALEGFLMQADYEEPCMSVGGINFDEFNVSKSMIERASILGKLCKSACIKSPLSSSFEDLNLNKVPNLFHSLPTGLLESMDLKSNLLMTDQNKLLKDGSSFLSGEVNCSPHGSSFSDCFQSFGSQLACNIKKPFASPFGKFLDRISSNSSSSGKQGSLNVELPCISEENENIDEIAEKFVKDRVSEVITNSVKRVPLADITENSNLQVTVCEAAIFGDRCSLESLNNEFSNAGTHNRIKENVGNEKSSKRKYLNKAENQDLLPGANGVKRVTRSSYNRFSRADLSCKDNFKKEGPRFSEKESKHKNIVSNITSFIPLVQQREAATILKGKRGIKVKAIEAAEAAKRLAEKKENERQMRKEALKLERARVEQENLRQLELEKKKKEEERKKKEEERKKKEADMAAKKRQREEEERKEKERKRMRVEEVRRRLREHGGKLRYDKEKKEVNLHANDQKPCDRKECMDETEKMEKGSGSDNVDKLSVTESKFTASTSGAEKASFAMEDLETRSVDCLEAEVPKNVMVNKVAETSEEQSYQISPYKCSDDEDEDEDDNDDILNNKFVPSWASKDCLPLLFASQQKVNPEVIFPLESFCDIAEVLLPRKHQK